MGKERREEGDQQPPSPTRNQHLNLLDLT